MAQSADCTRGVLQERSGPGGAVLGLLTTEDHGDGYTRWLQTSQQYTCPSGDCSTLPPSGPFQVAFRFTTGEFDVAAAEKWVVGAGWTITLNEGADHTTIVMSHESLNVYGMTNQVRIPLEPLVEPAGTFRSATVSGCFGNLDVWSIVPTTW